MLERFNAICIVALFLNLLAYFYIFHLCTFFACHQQMSSVKQFSVDQVASLQLSRKLPPSSAVILALGTPAGDVDTRTLLEAACFDPTVHVLILSVHYFIHF